MKTVEKKSILNIKTQTKNKYIYIMKYRSKESQSGYIKIRKK